MDKEFESPALFAIYRKKVPGKIPIPFLAQKERLDGFSTRRVRFANSLFYVPFCSAKRWTKSSSLSALFVLYRKKVPGKIPIPFLSVGYEKDVFPFLQERVELSSDLHLQMIFSVMI